MKKRITAGIVTFNPDMERLQENINSIYSQVEKVIIFDNGSFNQEEIRETYKEKVVLVLSDKNIGIAAALNRLMKMSEKLDADWMISLDQDSICPQNYVSDMEKYLYKEKKIGIVAPVIIDRNVGVVGHNPQEEYKSVKTCITSGAFTRLSVWKKLGGYDESMFIDSVDFEFCYRVRQVGYQVIQVKNIKLLHEIGHSEKRKFLFWNIDVTGHSAFRKYYIARNNIYYPMKHKLWLHFIRGNIRNLELIIIVILYEDKKREKLDSICKGWKDAYEWRKWKDGN